MFQRTADVPAFVKRELEKLEEKITPIMKKASKYMFISYPLIFISVLNLFLVLFGMATPENAALTVVVYAVIGAVGMALSKEGKLLRKDTLKRTADYIIERINKSEDASESMKKKYIMLVKGQQILLIQHFIEFLKEEKRERLYS
jgi:TRAP-type C4-dicarboxylate transport system permease large subunit